MPDLSDEFVNGLSTLFSTSGNNLLKGLSLTEGLSLNATDSIMGTGIGLISSLAGQGINALGGDSRFSRGLGNGVSRGMSIVGDRMGKNLLTKGKNIWGQSKKILDSGETIKEGSLFNIGGANGKNPFKSTEGSINPYAMGALVLGSMLEGFTGSSKEYGGEYGGVTQTMDTVYDGAQAAVGYIPGVGQAVSGIMALNKGLSNLFGSTSGETLQDAILGSAFMPAPVKWLNMAGAKTTGTFKNQSWLNTEKVNDFMGSSFGNIGLRFDRARKKAGKTYGTFSRHAYNKELENLTFANNAWGTIMSMADLSELLNIRSQYMNSINNLRYAQLIQGGWSPLARGKQGMKIFNNATNHKIGMRLLSGAALIDDKLRILLNY